MIPGYKQFLAQNFDWKAVPWLYTISLANLYKST